MKPDNVLVNYGPGDIRFSDVQLADCGSTVPADSAYAKDSDLIGAPIWRSPEAQLQIGWGTPTDIWSFGTLVCTSPILFLKAPSVVCYYLILIGFIHIPAHHTGLRR